MPVKTILDRTDEAFSGIRKGMSSALMVIALDIEGDMKRRIMDGPKTGRTYRRGATSVAGGSRNTKKFSGMGLNRTGKGRIITGYRFHRASAEGEAPANDLGGLANSIQASRKSEKETQVNIGKGYGQILEEKRNRPFAKPAVENVIDRIPDIVMDEVNKQVPG